MASNMSENTESKQYNETSPSIEMCLKIVSSPDNEINYRIVEPGTLIFLPSEIPCLRREKSNKAEGKQHIFTKIFESEPLEEVYNKSIQHRVTDFLNGKCSTIMIYGMKNSGTTYDLSNYVISTIDYMFSKIKCTVLPWYKPTDQGTVVYLNNTARKSEKAYKDKMNLTDNAPPCSSKYNYTFGKKLSISTYWSDNSKEKYTVWLSFVEVYKGHIYDLLNDTKPHKSSNVYMNTFGQAYVHNLKKIHARTASEAKSIIQLAKSKIMPKTKEFNNSISHTIFTIELLHYEKDKRPEEVTFSSLTFYDLASVIHYEQNSYLHEMRSINNSFLALNMCLMALSQNQMVPFRQSKLTQLCQHLLSGKEDLTIIVNVVFETGRLKEVRRILDFCDKVRKLIDKENKLKVKGAQNSKIMISRKVLKKLKKEKKDLTFDLALANQELEKFRQLVRDEICNCGGNNEGVEDTTDCLLNYLLQLMYGKIKDAEKKFEEANEKIRIIPELEAERLYYQLQTVRLQHEIQQQNLLFQEKQLTEDKQYKGNTKTGSISDKEGDQSTNILVDDNEVDKFLSNNMSISKSSSLASIFSPTINQLMADDWINIPRPASIQAVLENDINFKSSDNKSNDDLSVSNKLQGEDKHN